MTSGEPNKSSGSPPEHHPEHPKVPSAALKPLDARSFAPVHRNRPPPVATNAPGPSQPPSPPSPSYSYVKTLFLSPSPLASPRAGPPGVGGFYWAAPTAADPESGVPPGIPHEVFKTHRSTV